MLVIYCLAQNIKIYPNNIYLLLRLKYSETSMVVTSQKALQSICSDG